MFEHTWPIFRIFPGLFRVNLQHSQQTHTTKNFAWFSSDFPLLTIIRGSRDTRHLCKELTWHRIHVLNKKKHKEIRTNRVFRESYHLSLADWKKKLYTCEGDSNKSTGREIIDSISDTSTTLKPWRHKKTCPDRVRRLLGNFWRLKQLFVILEISSKFRLSEQLLSKIKFQSTYQVRKSWPFHRNFWNLDSNFFANFLVLWWAIFQYLAIRANSGQA